MRFITLFLLSFVTLSAEITFKVSDVKLAKKPLTLTETKELIEARVYAEVEDFHSEHDKLVKSEIHPVIYAAQRAFNDHRPLTLSPDIFWLMISQGVATHIKANPEKMRDYLVDFEGKKTLRVREDSFVKGSKENDWPKVFPQFVKQIKENSKKNDLVDILNGKFSTTTSVEQVAFQVSIMDTYSNFFDYDLDSFCGIPSITLQGSPEDWQLLIEKTEALAKYDLDWWVKDLTPILKKIHESSKGQVDKFFWESFFKYHSRSGGDKLTGWLIKFFPYFKFGAKYERNEYIGQDLDKIYAEAVKKASKYLKGKDKCRDFEMLGSFIDEKAAGLSPTVFPSGMSVVPFKWNYLDKTYNMEFLAGFIGLSQKEDLGLKPELCWAVREVLAFELSMPEGVKRIRNLARASKELMLSPDDVDLEDFKYFANLRGITWLSIDHPGVKDEDLRHFQNYSSLQDISLTTPKCSFKALKYFSKNKKLFSLRLTLNGKSDGIQELYQFKSLRTLGFGENRLEAKEFDFSLLPKLKWVWGVLLNGRPVKIDFDLNKKLHRDFDNEDDLDADFEDDFDDDFEEDPDFDNEDDDDLDADFEDDFEEE